MALDSKITELEGEEVEVSYIFAGTEHKKRGMLSILSFEKIQVIKCRLPVWGSRPVIPEMDILKVEHNGQVVFERKAYEGGCNV